MARYRILVADDDPVQREVLGEYLGLSGYVVLEAADGVEALEQAREHGPDLILLDVQMPNLDGFQTLHQLQKDQALSHIPVLLVTQLGSGHLKVKGLEAGADDYITKPFDRAELLARVRTGLRRTRRYRRVAGSLAGDLGDVGLDELFHTLHIGKKSGTVRLVDMDGTIEVHRGQLSRCHYRQFSGDEALSRVLLQAAGRFTVDFGVGSETDHGEGEPVEHNLVSAFVYLDETRRVMAELPTGDPLVELVAEGAPPEPLERLRPLLPLPLTKLLVLMQGELQDNAAVLAAAYREGALAVVDGASESVNKEASGP